LAERGKSTDKPDLTPDALAPAPGDQPPDAVPIYGILGKSPVASSVRLFLDVALTTYYDIPIEGIVKREKVPADQSPLGVDSSLLFVLKGVKLVVHHTETRTVEEEFLSGDFTSPGSFTPDPGVVQPGLPQGLPSEICRSNLGCPTRFIEICRPSLGITCTFNPPCGIRSFEPCPSVQLCRTRAPQFCPFTTDPCRVSVDPCPSVQPCMTRVPFCRPPLSHYPCPTVQLCPPTHPPLCPMISATPCPTVGPCPTIDCGAGGGGDPLA
jgi:hypothetical protein